MEKIDFKKTMKPLYAAPRGRFVEIDVPELSYVMIDGEGDPNRRQARVRPRLRGPAAARIVVGG